MLVGIADEYLATRPNLNLSQKNFSVFYIAPPGGGKTTLTKEIIKRCGATYVSNDEIRHLLLEHPEVTENDDTIGKVCLTVWHKIVTTSPNHFVVFDAISNGFFRRPDSYLNVSRAHNFVCYCIDIQLPRDLLVQRIQQRSHVVQTSKILEDLDNRLAMQEDARSYIQPDYRFGIDSSVDELIAHLTESYQAA